MCGRDGESDEQEGIQGKADTRLQMSSWPPTSYWAPQRCGATLVPQDSGAWNVTAQMEKATATACKVSRKECGCKHSREECGRLSREE